MKTISYFLTLASIVFVLTACEDEDKIRIPEALSGANMRWVVDPAHAQINYQTLTTDYFGFDAYSENKDLSTVEITVQYRDEIKVIQTLGQADFDDGHERLEYDANDFASLFGVPGLADGSRGGNFAFRPRVTLNDGRIYPDYVVVSAQDSFLNLGTGITGAANGAFTLRINTSITCAPRDISGTYVVVSATGTSTDVCCPDATTISGTAVEIAVTSGTVFSVSDITGGLYFEWYDVYDVGADDSPGNVSFNCGEVLIVSSSDPFDSVFQGDGLFDITSNRITYDWTNRFGDTGTVVLQRQ